MSDKDKIRRYFDAHSDGSAKPGKRVISRDFGFQNTNVHKGLDFAIREARRQFSSEIELEPVDLKKLLEEHERDSGDVVETSLRIALEDAETLARNDASPIWILGDLLRSDSVARRRRILNERLDQVLARVSELESTHRKRR